MTKNPHTLTLDEVNLFYADKGRLPCAQEMYTVPTTWIPVKESNPSKLTLHYFDNGKWTPTVYVKFVEWPEMFPRKPE